MDASPDIEKQAPQLLHANVGARFGWRDVVRVIPDDEARSRATAVLRTAGFTADDFGRLKTPKELIATFLSLEEDRLEFVAGSKAKATRLEIREFRRRLEAELWP